MTIYFAIAAAFILIGLWNLTIAVLGLFPRFRSTAVGTLTTTNTYKNMRTKSGTRIPNVTKYTYTYTVNGRKYKYTSEGHHSKRKLNRKTTIVYIKWFPRHGYPNEFKGTLEWIYGIGITFLGLLLLYVSITA